MTSHGDPADKRAFRVWVRAHHPDLGGDPEAFAEGLQQWRARMTGRRSVPGPQVVVTGYRRRRGVAGWVAHWRRRRSRFRSLRLR